MINWDIVERVHVAAVLGAEVMEALVEAESAPRAAQPTVHLAQDSKLLITKAGCRSFAATRFCLRSASAQF